MYLIYKHTSKTTGKSYIGKTVNIFNPNKRWKNGLGYTEASQPAFYNAIKKYGWDDFDSTILENYIMTAEEAAEREKYYIAYYHTYVGSTDCNGYNLTIGGEGTEKHQVSEETRAKLRTARLTQTNLSLTHNKGKFFYNNGKVCGMFFPGEEPEGFIKGRLMSQSAKDKISKAVSQNNKNRKGKLQKICIIKDEQVKCIGKANLQSYLDSGWSIYKKGSGGKLAHGKK